MLSISLAKLPSIADKWITETRMRVVTLACVWLPTPFIHFQFHQTINNWKNSSLIVYYHTHWLWTGSNFDESLPSHQRSDWSTLILIWPTHEIWLFCVLSLINSHPHLRKNEISDIDTTVSFHLLQSNREAKKVRTYNWKWSQAIMWKS
jgi:hypothetical protein